MGRYWGKLLVAFGLLVVGTSSVHADSQTVRQSGNVTAGHPVVWIYNGIVGDGGSSLSPQFSGLGLYNGASCPLTISSQTTAGAPSGAYSILSFCQTGSLATITTTGYGGNAPTMDANINGTVITFPGSNIVGISDTQTLTNKTMDGLLNTFLNLPISSLGSQAANTVIGNATNAAADPTAVSLPTCNDTAGQHINYTLGSGFSCGTTSSSPETVRFLSKSTNYTILASDVTSGSVAVDVDTSAGNVTITVPPGLGTASAVVRVLIIKTTSDANLVLISDGTSTIGSVGTQAAPDGSGSTWAVANGTTIIASGNPTPLSVNTIASLQAIVSGGTVTSGIVTGAQGAGMTFEKVACGGAGQPSCTADNVITFSISGDASHVLQRQIAGAKTISALWAGAVGDAHPETTFSGTDDCVAMQRALNASVTYGMPVGLQGRAYLINYTAVTCPGITINQAYSSIEGPGGLVFGNWTVAQTGLCGITMQETTSTDITFRAIQAITRPLRNLTVWGPNNTTGVNAICFADYTPAIPAQMAAYNIDEVGMNGFANAYVIGAGNWGITWNSPSYWGVGGRVTGSFLKLNNGSSGIERLVINNPIIVGNTQSQQAFLVDAGHIGTTDVYLHGGSLDALNYISTGQTTTIGDTDPRTCLHVSQTHIENLAGQDYAVRVGNGGCAVFRDLGTFSYISSSPHTKPFALDNAGTGDVGLIIDSALTNLNNTNGDGFDLAVDGTGPVSVDHLHGGNGPSTWQMSAQANNLVPNWLFPTTPLGGASPFVTVSGTITYDTTSPPPANGAVGAATGSIKLDATAAATYLKFPVTCKPGQVPIASFYAKTTGITAGVPVSVVDWFEDSAGNRIGGTYTIFSATSNIAAWTLEKAKMPVVSSNAVAAPPGTAKCVIQWGITATGAATMNVGKIWFGLQ